LNSSSDDCDGPRKSTQGRPAKEAGDVTTTPRFTPSSGNVFRDLDLPSAEEALAKAELAARIAEIIAGMKLTQAAAGEILGVDQPKISALMRGRLTDFSTDRLIKFLTNLGRDVDIVVRSGRSSRRRGRFRVVAEETR
jgi:predicted XRE-type DNA-binding protein